MRSLTVDNSNEVPAARTSCVASRATAGRHATDVPSAELLGIPVSRVTLATAVQFIAGWIARRESRYVAVCDVHSLMLGRKDASHRLSLTCADMITPDGQPIAWTLRHRGYADVARTCGPELLPAVCERSVQEGWTHYFYGGADGVADMLARRMAEQYPGLNIAGTECPPFRPLSDDERMAAIERIRASGADIVWVGLGCPKQERWMHEHRALLPGVVLIGIGAAFDFHTDRIERAPRWMRDNGLEWLHRLTSEPRRLWRRYLVMAPQFLFSSMAETVALKWKRRARPST
jgi:N-acetylglucosaminyldiphosphoundecaprenol N-acetyl-beta-D-mannosaminyltransferase